MATRSTAKSDPIRETTLELTKAALVGGALQQGRKEAAGPVEQARFDAIYVATLFSTLEARLRTQAAAQQAAASSPPQQ